MMESTTLYRHKGASMTHDPMRRGGRAIADGKTRVVLDTAASITIDIDELSGKAQPSMG